MMFGVGSGPLGNGSVVVSGGSHGTPSVGTATDGSGVSVTAGGAHAATANRTTHHRLVTRTR
jgi:hypothetical protein